MSKGKKIGYFILGLTPAVIVLIWQMVVTLVMMFLYMAMRMTDSEVMTLQTDPESYNAIINQITNDFTSGTSMAVSSFVIYVGYLLIFGLWYYFMFCRKKQTGSWKQVLNLKRILCIFGAGILIQLGLDMVLMLILPLFPKIYESYMGIMEGLGSNSVFMVICVCILAPIGEELIFRGLTFRILKKAVPWQAALIVQAVLFGVYHLNLVQGIYATVLGLCFGYLAYKYGSIIPGIFLHMVINSSSYVIGNLLPESLAESNIMMILVAIVSLGVSAFLLYLSGKNVTNMENTVTLTNSPVNVAIQEEQV